MVIPDNRAAAVTESETKSSQDSETKSSRDLDTKPSLWSHDTISRDETSASGSVKDRLNTVLFSGIKIQSSQDNPDLSVENLSAAASISTRFARFCSPLSLGKGGRKRNVVFFNANDNRDKEVSRAAPQRNLPRPAPTLLSTSYETLLEFSSSPESKMPNQGDREPESPTDKQGKVKGLGDEENDFNALESDAISSATISNQELMLRIVSLERENKRLQTSQVVASRFEVLHYIPSQQKSTPDGFGMVYLDEPTWSIGPNGEVSLGAKFPITDVSGFLGQHPEIAFVVAASYTPQKQTSQVIRAVRAKRVLPRPKPTSETIKLRSPDLIDAVDSFLAQRPTISTDFPWFNDKGEIPAPYLFWYHHRGPTALDVLGAPHRKIMSLLTSWIEEHYAEIYNRVNDTLNRGVVTENTMPFLVKPGDVLVWKEKDELNAVIAKGWTCQKSPIAGTQTAIEKDRNRKEEKTASKMTEWTVDSWRFAFDGKFDRIKHPVDIVLNSDDPDEEIRIEELNVYPLDYAPAEFKPILEERGKSFWRCRNQYLVSYEDRQSAQNNAERFMVDFHTYQQLHPYMRSSRESHDYLDSAAMASDEPPAAPSIYVFPNMIPGYNLRSKKWVDLKVDMIKEVTWNKKSFEHLVVDDETKELVQALVKHQIATEKSTDIIDRKGNGLIMLLHGGPGTGKTFTAESVAEMAEKPLFRITCGDIGTEPEKVEKYLDSVLHLGKVWDCIVLIDEAEVFLEQRSLEKLERNALVSVFLRVLEYYEGILILTSNRVGTFDEAFKSRILLSLHYENLTKGQRTKIWKNFFKRLKELNKENDKRELPSSVSSITEPGSRKRKFQGGTEVIDFDDIDCYVHELAKHELNGRQIRNVITTARQLAVSRDEPMQYKHLVHVIKVSSKFDKYLKTVQEGYSDDQIARDGGLR